MRLKNGCALLGSKSQLWVRPLLQLPRPGARDEACSPSPPAPGLSGAEAEQPRSCQRLSAVTQRRPSAAVVAQLQRRFRPSCWGVGCTLAWQLSLEQERLARPERHRSLKNSIQTSAPAAVVKQHKGLSSKNARGQLPQPRPCFLRGF